MDVDTTPRWRQTSVLIISAMNERKLYLRNGGRQILRSFACSLHSRTKVNDLLTGMEMLVELEHPSTTTSTVLWKTIPQPDYTLLVGALLTR